MSLVHKSKLREEGFYSQNFKLLNFMGTVH